jgi:hypothetical protein
MYKEENFYLSAEDLVLLQNGKSIKCHGDNSALILIPPDKTPELFENHSKMRLKR